MCDTLANFEMNGLRSSRLLQFTRFGDKSYTRNASSGQEIYVEWYTGIHVYRFSAKEDPILDL